MEPLRTASVRDITVQDGTVYVLTGAPDAAAQAQWLSSESDGGSPSGWTGAVYSSKDLKSWTREAEFPARAIPFSLEVAQVGDRKVFYVGLAGQDYDAWAVDSGDVLRLVP